MVNSYEQHMMQVTLTVYITHPQGHVVHLRVLDDALVSKGLANINMRGFSYRKKLSNLSLHPYHTSY